MTYQLVVTDQALNALLETRLAALGVGGGGSGSTTGNVVTLEQYGSFAAGVADPSLDGPALTSALNALAAKGGGTLELYQNYLIAGNLTYSGDSYANITWRGKTPLAGFTHTADTASGANLPMIYFQGSDRYTLKNLKLIDVRFSGHSIDDWTKLIGFNNVDGVSLVRCKGFNNAVEGFYINAPSSCKNVEALNCHAENVGVRANLSAFNMNAERTLLLACKTVNCPTGVEQTGSHARILGNHFEGATFVAALIASTWDAYLAADGVTEVDCSDILVATNTFVTCASAIVTGDTTGHTQSGIPLKGNQGRILVATNIAKDCGQFFSGGADSMTQVVLRGNDVDGGGVNVSAFNCQRGRFLVEDNIVRLGTAPWAYVFRIADKDPQNCSAVVQGNTIVGDAWTTAAYVLGANVTLGRNTFDGITNRTAVYYSFCGLSRETDGDISAWISNTDTWFVATDPDALISPTQPNRLRVKGSPPAKGTWKVGDRAENILSTGTLGWRCIVAGTADTILSGVTATTTSGNANVTFASPGRLMLFQWVTITGLTGRYQITALNPSTGAATLSANASATVSAAAVAFTAPTWEVTGTLTTRAIATTATITAQDQLISYSTSGGAYAATLPLASLSEGHIVRFAKSDSSANALTIAAAGSDTINGASTFAPVATQYQVTHLYCIGGAWYAHDDGVTGGGGGAVSTVFGRSGAVTAQPNDYSYSQLSGKPATIAGISAGVAADFITQLEVTGDARYIQQGAAIPDSEITDSPFFTISAPGATPAAVWTSARRQQVMTLTQNAALTVSGIPAGGSLLVRVIQAASGGPYTLTHAVSGLGTLFPDLGVTPVMSSGAGKFDDYLYRYDGTRTVYARVLTGAG